MAGVNVVVADGYDLDTFERMLAASQSLQGLGERLGRLLPHPESLLCDLFCVLFKLNLVMRPERDLPPSALINRAVVLAVLESDGLETLRHRTALDETNAAVAAAMLARRVLDALKRAFRKQPQALVSAADSVRNEHALAAKAAELAHLRDSKLFDPPSREALNDELKAEMNTLTGRLRRDRRSQREAAKTASAMERALDAGIEHIAREMEAPDRAARAMGLSGAGTVDADRRLELGERFNNSDKLRRLARLVGAMRELAFEVRRRRTSRSPQETHAITLGDELERLLPSEMLGLRKAGGGRMGRALRTDFLRRFSERQLLQYRLQAHAERGPMVICLDGSGSMQGAKELWGKAVALTLMEIARRERRRCLALIFSSGHPPFEVQLLARAGGGARARVRDEEVLRFAEHFPGGGTDFEAPLTRAVEAVTQGSYRRGDIVFITDGHAPVSENLVARIDDERKRHRFRIRAILVDVADHDRAGVEAFADDVRTVRDLATDAVGELFAAV